MNKSLFTSFLHAPLNLPKDSARLLEDVVKEFPYCQTAQLLFLKSLHLQNSIHYNNQLKIAAAFATDRSVLHQLITRKEKPVSEKSAAPGPDKIPTRNDEQIVTELKIPAIPEKKNSEPETKPLTGKIPALSPQEILEARLRELNAPKQEGTLETPVSEVKKTEEKTLPEKQAPAINAKKTAPVPEPEYLTEPVDTSDTLKTEKDLETLSDTYISTAIDASMRIRIDLEEDREKPVTEQQAVPEPEETPAEQSFYAWLKKSHRTADKATQTAEDEQKSEERRKQETELIDRFIQEEPRITKPKKEFYNPVNMARQSVVEDLDFVTETLAGIYAKQGNTAKAIRAYQTLSLKYPEKKLYFASLIEKLEGEGK